MMAGASRWGLASLLSFVAVAVATLIAWQVGDHNPVTGDEPHYLVMADSLVADRSLEVTDAYRREFRDSTIYKDGLAPGAVEPTELNTHAVDGQRGLYSVHSYGVPVLVAVPYAIGGAFLAKLMMIAVAAAAVWVAWSMSAAYGGTPLHRALALGIIVIGVNFVTSSTQLYPDLVTGAIALVGLAAIQRLEIGDDTVKPWVTPVAVSLLATLPWFHVKTAATAALLTLVIAALVWRRTRHWKSVALTFVPMMASLAFLAAYNEWAFGQAGGPYSDGALEAGGMPLTVFFGLYLDQFQGMFVQNPALLAALVAVGPFVRRFPVTGCTLVVAHLSLVVPNAMHINWYGGFSFTGRFGVAGALLLVPVAAYGISWVLARASWGGRILLGFLAAFHVVQFARYAVLERNLYNDLLSFPEVYPSQVPPARDWLPMFFQSSWAFESGTNVVAIAGCAAIVSASVLWAAGRPIRRWPPAAGVAAVALGASALVVGAVVAPPPDIELNVPGRKLPTVNGNVVENGVESDGTDGVVTFGPFVRVGAGPHSFSVRYTTPVTGMPVGEFFLTARNVDGVLAGGILNGAGGESVATIDFDVSDDIAGRQFELVTFSDGVSPLIVLEVSVADSKSIDP